MGEAGFLLCGEIFIDSPNPTPGRGVSRHRADAARCGYRPAQSRKCTGHASRPNAKTGAWLAATSGDDSPRNVCFQIERYPCPVEALPSVFSNTPQPDGHRATRVSSMGVGNYLGIRQLEKSSHVLWLRTVTTEQRAVLRTRSATLPSMTCEKPRLPWVPMTIRSARCV